MVMQQQRSYQPTASQLASAIMHLENREDWHNVRIDTTRYVVIVSGHSGRVYFVRADADGCQCLWYTNTGRQCSHMLSLELAAMEDELSEQPAPVKTIEDLWPTCWTDGCDNDPEPHSGGCHKHANSEAF